LTFDKRDVGNKILMKNIFFLSFKLSDLFVGLSETMKRKGGMAKNFVRQKNRGKKQKKIEFGIKKKKNERKNLRQSKVLKC
jgi:hypothetical protein